MMLRHAGETAVSMDRFGLQEDWNLNQILLQNGRAATESILGKDMVFDLAAILVDRGGANLRNIVAHGTVQDGGLEGGLSRYFFWACLRLCMFPIIAAVEEARLQREAPERGNTPDEAGTEHGGGEIRGKPPC
jgi:hypothetical protein